MVKGMARRVGVVKSPDKRVFEEAIFILKDDALRESGVTAEDILGEACRVARGYMRSHSRRGYWKYVPYAAVGLAMGALGWLLATCL